MSPHLSRRMFLPLILGSAALLAGCQTTGGLSSHQIKGLTGAGFQHTDRGYEYVFPERLLFAVDKSELLPEQKPALTHMGSLLVALKIPATAVEGHTDSSGSEDYNLALSQRRAKTVGDEIIATGYPASKLTITGLGEAYPIESNDTEEGRRENRRVVILVTAR